MVTRRDLYGGEAMELLRVVSTYRCLLGVQLYRLFPGRESVIQKLLIHLERQKRISFDSAGNLYALDGEYPDTGMVAAFWVLLDFIDRVEYHTAGEFPVKISFFADGEDYEIIHVPAESEILIAHALSCRRGPPARRLIVIDRLEQINRFKAASIAAFCMAAPDGAVQYYKIGR